MPSRKNEPGFDLTYLSLGAGVQSTALLICSALGLHGVPRAEVAIFADTGDEPAEVYRHLWALAEWSTIPVEVVSYGHLSADVLTKTSGQLARPPLFLRNPDGSDGFLNRQCTQTYKVAPINKRLRAILGYQPRQRIKKQVRAMIGISLDECDRMKPNPESWIENAWPLIDARLTREGCRRICEEHLGYAPAKSACVFCPFHGDGEWRRIRREWPDEFANAVAFDGAIRGVELGLDGVPFIHRQRVPLDAVDFGDSQRDMFAEECAGVCGV